MKLVDAVNDHIGRYPSGYINIGDTYETCELRVLHHMFLVLGNGMEWAYTKDVASGGYLTDPKHYKQNDEWVRKYDVPYGKEKHNGPSVERMLTEPFVEINGFQKNNGLFVSRDLHQCVHNGFLADLPSVFHGKVVPGYARIDSVSGEYALDDNDYFQRDDPRLNFIDPEYVITIENIPWRYGRSTRWVFEPYPFSTQYWPFAEIETSLIKPDWRDGMIRVFEYALRFYTEATQEEYGQYNNPKGMSEAFTKWGNSKGREAATIDAFDNVEFRRGRGLPVKDFPDLASFDEEYLIARGLELQRLMWRQYVRRSIGALFNAIKTLQ